MGYVSLPHFLSFANGLIASDSWRHLSLFSRSTVSRRQLSACLRLLLDSWFILSLVARQELKKYRHKDGFYSGRKSAWAGAHERQGLLSHYLSLSIVGAKWWNCEPSLPWESELSFCPTSGTFCRQEWTSTKSQSCAPDWKTWTAVTHMAHHSRVQHSTIELLRWLSASLHFRSALSG